MQTPPFSSPTSSSAFTPPCSSPISSTSAFTRSLAASCISQSISQSIARQNNVLQQTQPRESPSPHLRLHSSSPKPPPGQQASSISAQQGVSKDVYQRQKSLPSSTQPCSPSPMQSPPALFLQRTPSPSLNLVHHHSSSPRSSFLHARSNSSQNLNNNNNIATMVGCNGSWAVSSQKTPLANGSHESLWTGLHNRVAQPFSSSEPSSRVQSPTPSLTPAPFTRLCSPPPQHNYSSPMANKPPHPRSTRGVGVGSCNPLGLTLELSRSSSSNTCLSPRILSPPPIGVSVNVWPNNVAAPQARKPRCTSSSLLPSFSSSLGSPTLENASFPTSPSSMLPLWSCRTSSPASPCMSQTSQNPHSPVSSSLADTFTSPQSDLIGLHRSCGDSSHRSLGFSGSGQGSFEQQDSSTSSLRNGLQGSLSSSLTPHSDLHSPLSINKPNPGESNHVVQHLTSVPWPDARELSNKHNGTDNLDRPATIATSPPLSSLSPTRLTSPGPSENQTDWGVPDLEEGSCRSQLICAYVAPPLHEQSVSSSCMSSPLLPPFQLQPPVQSSTPTPPLPSSPSSSSSSPPLHAHSFPDKQKNHKTSYATTVNFQIGGSGRITSFSTAQVSLTQTLQGGAGGPGQGQAMRRVSINGLSHLPSSLPQN